MKKRNGQSRPSKRFEKVIKEQADHKDRVRRANDERRQNVNFVDLQPDPILEDEFFGGFRPSDDRSEGSLKARPERARVLFLLPVEQRGFARHRQRSPGWAAEPTWLTDGQTEERARLLARANAWPKWRKTSAATAKPDHPGARRLTRLAEQQRPTVTPERDRDDDVARQDSRQARLERPTNSNAGPSTTFARGVRHTEYAQFLSRSGEQRTQKLVTGGFKPSKALQAERFPKLKRVPLNPAVTNEYLSRRLRSEKDHARMLGVLLSRGVQVQVCPPETLAAKVRKPKIGRPRVYDRPMMVAERKAVSRAMQVKAPAPNRRVRPDADWRPHPPPSASGFFYPNRAGLMRIIGCSSRIGIIEHGVIRMVALLTPRRATSSLIGAMAIPPVSELDRLSAKLHILEEQRRAVAHSDDELAKRRARAREAKTAVMVWRVRDAALMARAAG